jgi:hypothetical protein
MPETSLPRRPWWKLHHVTWIASAMVIAALLVMNLFCHPYRSGVTGHGWPLLFSRRDIFSGAYWFAFAGEWQLDKSALLIDLVVAALILAAVVYKSEWFCRLFTVRPLVSVKALLVAIAWFACFLAAEKRDYDFDWMLLVRGLAAPVTYGGMALAWLAFFDVLGAAWNRFADRRGKK